MQSSNSWLSTGRLEVEPAPYRAGGGEQFVDLGDIEVHVSAFAGPGGPQPRAKRVVQLSSIRLGQLPIVRPADRASCDGQYGV